LTVTPDDLSLVHETVRVTTADGVDLAGWYLPSANGAAVVMLHGAGSTRSNVLHHAAALAESGFGVVALDARGHGESDGVAMDFGWYGDLDIAAGVDYLEQRPEVDPARIGLVGFSLGGEAAIGAASGDARIRAVVAEGATGRQADDKDWYSDVYGWRGWVQEQIEKVQFGLVDLLTIAGPPTALRDSIAQAAPTQFLLITAATVPDEGHAAEDLRAAAPDRVEVWTIDGVGHTGGYERDPVGWQRRVTSFLDDAL
jgi:dienelactone hydrolase